MKRRLRSGSTSRPMTETDQNVHRERRSLDLLTRQLLPSDDLHLSLSLLFVILLFFLPSHNYHYFLLPFRLTLCISLPVFLFSHLNSYCKSKPSSHSLVMNRHTRTHAHTHIHTYTPIHTTKYNVHCLIQRPYDFGYPAHFSVNGSDENIHWRRRSF